MAKAYEINWDDDFLPMYGIPISIISNTILWRGCDPKYESISDRPSYYGSQQIAQEYANKYGINVIPFITSRIINLLDIRYMKVLLSQLFEYNQPITRNDVDIFKATSVSFGLCSLQHQIKLFKDRYKAIYRTSNQLYNDIKKGIENLEISLNPNALYEQQGVRIAETTNDAIVMGFLKELFGKHYDGFISPKIYSPFHIEKSNLVLNSELILFNPSMSGIRKLNTMPKNIEIMSIDNFINLLVKNYTTINTNSMSTSYYSKNINKKGGSKLQDIDNNILYDDYNYLYDKGDKNIIELYNKGKKIGKKWSEKQCNIITVTSPRPTVNPSIFNHYNNIN